MTGEDDRREDGTGRVLTMANRNQDAARQAIAGLVTALAVFDDPRSKYHQVVSAVAAAARRVVQDVPPALIAREHLVVVQRVIATALRGQS